MKEAFLVNCMQMKCLHALPDIRESKATQQIWQKNDNLWVMFETCTALCEWASQNKVDRRLVQMMAARLQVGIHSPLPELAWKFGTHAQVLGVIL